MKHSKFKAGITLRSIIRSNPEILKYTENIFPLVAPKSTEGDIIIYQRDEYSKTYTNMGIASEVCKVYVSAVSDDYDRSAEMAELLNDTLCGEHPQYGVSIKLEDSTELFENGKYFQVLLFSIK